MNEETTIRCDGNITYGFTGKAEITETLLGGITFLNIKCYDGTSFLINPKHIIGWEITRTIYNEQRKDFKIAHVD